MDNAELEKQIRLAMKDPSLDFQMIQMLLSSTLLALCEGEDDEGEGDTGEDDPIGLSVHVLDDGTRYVPVFTSLKEMGLWDEEGDAGLPIDGWDVFSLVAEDDLELVINPLGKHPLHFSHEDVINILNDFGLTNIEEESLKIVGVVEDDPVQIKNVLTEFFSKDQNISQGFMALAQDVQTEQKTILVGILPTEDEVDGGILNMALNAAFDELPEGHDLNFMIIDVTDDAGESLSQGMLRTGIKFYDKIWKA
ncbi:MAG: hypothetical protein AUJ12_08215 [Alphaproteobacteria bacterium CG1_02_46_17]|nr:MAG: hypothetical protein AUJ12_08215 [Alphaproteobacteria bacterium CG1_02_46_17]